ncbi:hypothetical protein AB0H69_26495 [Streptomyces phaeochromogenes]|uniref:MmyB family transcriptional regulator n=1 Tax=Streptomyces phaeochromogenes TaxID=1923 RepID=UPI0033F3E46D
MKSDRFLPWWAGQKVVEPSRGAKSLHHPIAGRLTLRTEALTFPGDPDQTLFTFLADPGSPSDEALTVLSAWAADHARATGSTTDAPKTPRATPYR